MKDALVGQRARSSPPARAARAAKLAVRPPVRPPRSRATSTTSRARQARSSADLAPPVRQRIAAGPIRGNGQLIWPVNGTITSPFCESRAWERCHPGMDIAVARGHADPRRRRRQGRHRRVHRRLRELHVHPAHRVADHVLRPPVGVPRARRGSRVSRGPGHREGGLDRATRPARTSTSRRASTAPSRTR